MDKAHKLGEVMEFPSFIPRKGSDRRKAPPTTSDPNAATVVDPAWTGMLRDHLAAQRPPTVGPEATRARDGSRHSQDQTRAPQAGGRNAETTVFPKIDKPAPGYFSSAPQAPRPTETPRTNFNDPTTMMRVAQSMKSMPDKRVLRYYSDNRGILTIVGIQVHSADARGVRITPNGFDERQQIIPWHRVHELTADPDDPILGRLGINN